MKKKFLGFLLAIIVSFGIAQKASAVVGNDLPAADNPFWNVMSQLDTPDDPTCQTKAKAVLDAAGIPGDTSSMATQMCNGIAQIKTTMQPQMASDGVNTNLFDQTNWHTVEDLYFEKTNFGKIQFSKDIDFMSRDFMLFIANFGEKMDMSQGEIGLDADTVEALRTAGATLTMYNVPDYSNLEILINGQEDTSGVVSNLTYNQAGHTITFNAAHFTTFTAHDKNSDRAEKPKLTKVVAERSLTTKGEKIIILTLTGKHFKNKTEIKLGNTKASSINKKSSKLLVAKFKVKKLEKVGRDDFKLRANNPNSNNAIYKHKIRLSEIK